MKDTLKTYHVLTVLMTTWAWCKGTYMASETE